MIERSETFAMGFEFARQLRDPGFRAQLRAVGWTSGVPVIMASDDEPVGEVLRRMIAHEMNRRAVIVIADTREPFGFRLMDWP